MTDSISYTYFLQNLRTELQSPLPGFDAQMSMAPNPRSGERLPYDAPRADARQSAVLILLYPHNNELHLVLTLRPTYDGMHSGQVSFPGGRYEEGDENLTATALRECHEEIGVCPDEMTVIGQLTPLYVFVSNNRVTPIMAWCAHRPNFQPDAREVAQLLEVPLRHLLDPANRQVEQWHLRDRLASVPFYAVAGQKVWGATAMILGEMLALPVFMDALSPTPLSPMPLPPMPLPPAPADAIALP